MGWPSMVWHSAVVAFRCPEMRAELWSKTQSGRLERRVVPPATCGSTGAAKRKEIGESTIGSEVVDGASWAVGIWELCHTELTSRRR
jgi:hypothetical protein